MEPLHRQLLAAPLRVGLHVRTLRADHAYCFSDATPPVADAIDAEFGNERCVARSPDRWRFWLLPKSGVNQTCGGGGPRLSPRIYPLSRWLVCARRRVGEKASVFLSTDAPALQRYAATALPHLRILSLPGAEISHTHRVGHSEASLLRSAADWYLLSLSHAILAPVGSAFAKSACTTRSSQRCGIRFVTPVGTAACELAACFDDAPACATCQWKVEYGGGGRAAATGAPPPPPPPLVPPPSIPR